MQDVRYLTVSALTKYIKQILENDKHLSQIYIKGEISNLTKHSRGHFYFTLKDEGAQIRVTMFANYVKNLNFNPKDGDKVRLFGSMSVYEAGGSYAINAYTLELDGIGNLYLAYEKLKKELSDKGYFDINRKKSIPMYPKAIGVITSPTGAAIRDIIHTIERRYPTTRLYLYPALVQGEEAKFSIEKQIKQANQDGLVDVLIVGRGGGSIEDLWAFNEMPVIEAIYRSSIPIISAVGHETDFTLADFVSDLRAPTPTAAGELATPSKDNLLEMVLSYRSQIQVYSQKYMEQQKTKLMHLDERLMVHSPVSLIKQLKERYTQTHTQLMKTMRTLIEGKIHQYRMLSQRIETYDVGALLKYKTEKCDYVSNNLNHAYERIITKKEDNFQLLIQSLKHQNPLSLMDKGYTYTTKNQKRIESINEVLIDDIIETTLKDGKLTSVVKQKETHTWK
jgi:exodeoxyribonuclease VII large subunit